MTNNIPGTTDYFLDIGLGVAAFINEICLVTFKTTSLFYLSGHE